MVFNSFVHNKGAAVGGCFRAQGPFPSVLGFNTPDRVVAVKQLLETMTARKRALGLLLQQGLYPTKCQAAAGILLLEDVNRAAQHSDRRASTSAASTSDPTAPDSSPYRLGHTSRLTARGWPALGGMSIRAMAQQVRRVSRLCSCTLHCMFLDSESNQTDERSRRKSSS